MGRKFRPRIKSGIFTLLMLGILLGLGTWQVQRLHWKTALLETIHTRMAEPAVPLPEAIERPADWEYRRVTMFGRFLHDHQFLIRPRTLEGRNGYHMVVPFQRVSGGIVFVNRGWISEDLLGQARRPEGFVTVEGVVQQPRKTYFTPANDPKKALWYWPDVRVMAAAAKLEASMDIVVASVAREDGVWPAGGQIRLDIPNDHRQYAIFWYAMAVILCVMYVLFHLEPFKGQE